MRPSALGCAIASAAVLLAGCGGSSSPGAAKGEPLSPVLTFGEVGQSPGQFSYPRCIDHDDSTLFVIDKLARVQRLDMKTGRCVGQWRMPKWDNGKPTGVTVFTGQHGGKKDTLVYIADTHEHRVMVYRPAEPAAGPEFPAPELAASFGSYGEGDGQFLFPTDVAVVPTPDGSRPARVYVSEYGGHDRVSVFDVSPTLEHTFVFSFGRFGYGGPSAVEFNRPQSLAVDLARGELIVADACNHRLGRFRFDGSLIGFVGSPESAGSKPGQMLYPYGLALLPDGSALVSEFGNGRLQRFDLATGQSLGVYGRRGEGKGEMTTPWGVCVEGDLLYALDSGNNRIMAARVPRAVKLAQGAHP